MMWENRQISNVGNLGDIHKHAALMTLLMRLAAAEAQSGPGLYFESHAFVPRCPIGAEQAEVWRMFSSGLPMTAEVERYRDMESAAIERGEYLCSTGLAAEVVGGLGTERVGAVLCDRDERCRAALGRQYPRASVYSAAGDTEAGLEAHVPDLSSNWDAAGRTGSFYPVLGGAGTGPGIDGPAWVVGMVDPFVWGDEEAMLMAGLLVKLGRLAEGGSRVAVLCFGYGWEGRDWPKKSSRDVGFRGFSCTRLRAKGLDEKVYGLGLYADRRALKAVKPGLIQLGWAF